MTPVSKKERKKVCIADETLGDVGKEVFGIPPVLRPPLLSSKRGSNIVVYLKERFTS